MSTNAAFSGVSLGVVFCMISAGFDVYVANVIQEVNPAIFIIYCFILSTLVFSIISSVKKGSRYYFIKAKANFGNLFLVNSAVLLNWGGLILSLKYLEPAVVGIASVACGPALTLIISRYIIKDTSHPTKYEGYAAWVILTSVVVMLVNSYVGKSGVTDTTTTERIIGISCVVLSAIGTVLYTFFSKRLSTGDWKTYEILGVRNILMLLVTLFYMFSYEISFLLNKEMLLIILSLSIIGHILPVFLIQSSIATLDPIHVSLILLLLPIFTLLFQFFDPRIHISSETFITVIMITFLLIILSIVKLQKIDKDER